MRKRILSVLLVLVMLLLVLLYSLPVEAAESSDLQLMRVTCYTYPPGSITASGCEVREGIVAARKDWMGALVILYDTDMNFIGYFEVLDTGFGIDKDGDGVGSIQEGTSLDVFRSSLERCHEWTERYGDYCYAKIITDAKG